MFVRIKNGIKTFLTISLNKIKESPCVAIRQNDRYLFSRKLKEESSRDKVLSAIGKENGW
jgi:hypothetical protein